MPMDAAEVGFVAEDVFPLDLTAGEILVDQVALYAAVWPSVYDLDEQVRSLLELVGLDPVILNNRPDELSRGMQRRLAIALALAKDPAALVLEDVARDFDPQQARSVVHACCLLSSRGLTIVMGFPALSDADSVVRPRGRGRSPRAALVRLSARGRGLVRTAVGHPRAAGSHGDRFPPRGQRRVGCGHGVSRQRRIRAAGRRTVTSRWRAVRGASQSACRIACLSRARTSVRPADARPTRVPAGALPRGCRGLGCRGILHRLSRLVVALAGRAGNAV